MTFFKKRLDISVVSNPFFVFPASFCLVILIYILGWSDLYPRLSFSLVFFLVICSVFFVSAGILFQKKQIKSDAGHFFLAQKYLDLAFISILILGITDVAVMGYIPLFERSETYKEFGTPVVDVFFNTLSIFFSIVYLYSFLKDRKKRNLIYLIAILLFQFMLYRRSSMIWIITASCFLLIHHKRFIYTWILAVSILLIPVISYLFGFYGSMRSNLTEEYVIREFKPGTSFSKNELNYNHYMTYLYLSSPLANLQANIQSIPNTKFEKSVKEFIFYCIVPPSLTIRLEDKFGLQMPEHRLINRNLIVGTCFMISFAALGWTGISIMAILILVYIFLAVIVAAKSGSLSIISLSLIATAVVLAIFDNMFYRLDVIMMLFIYPLLFHYMFDRIPVSSESNT